MAIQLELDLFGIPNGISIIPTSEISSNSKLQWSYSRRGTLEQCPRRYYYQHYAANSRTAKAETNKKKISSLKQLTNRYLRTGNILHLVIRTYFKHRQQGKEPSWDRLLSWAADIYQRDLEYSIHQSSSTKTTFKPVTLLEFYYNYLDARTLWQESLEQLLIALKHFFTSPTLEPFRIGGSRSGALIEKRITLKEKHFTACGQIDLAYPDNSRTVLADWKIGTPNSGNENLQLQVYALWLAQQFQSPSNCIDLYQVHLKNDCVSAFTIQDKDLQRAKSRIIQDLERMQVVDRYGQNAVVDAFTPCKQQRVCNLCPFQEVCQ